MKALIYQPSKTAMQSGLSKTHYWLVEYEPEEPKVVDDLMGWVGSGDMRTQLKLKFKSKEEAVKYVEDKGVPYEIIESQTRNVTPKSYADNFRFDKSE